MRLSCKERESSKIDEPIYYEALSAGPPYFAHQSRPAAAAAMDCENACASVNPHLWSMQYSAVLFT